jgi:hypothetical protein
MIYKFSDRDIGSLRITLVRRLAVTTITADLTLRGYIGKSTLINLLPMSQRKHQHILSELNAHPINHNIEWVELLSALESIGLLDNESNGKHHFSRSGHTLVLDQSHDKTLSEDAVMRLRNFLKISAVAEAPIENMTDMIVAIDHHHAIIWHSPGTPKESIKHLHAVQSEGKTLHFHPTSPPFHDSNPKVDKEFFEAVVDEMRPGGRIAILSHGTGSSRGSDHLLEVIQKKRPELAKRILKVITCDLEAMTEPELAKLGMTIVNPS